MRRFLALLVPLILAGCAFAVASGDALVAVLAEKGEPASRLERDQLLVLTYPDVVVRLENGIVVSVKGPSADYAVKSTTPKPAPRVQARPAQAAGPAAGPAAGWCTDLGTALASARGTGRKVFVLFTGSDWCVWCKRLDAEILSTPEFQSYAADSLVLVKLDFPRRRPQQEAVRQRNKRLAAKYRVQGYPTVVVFDETGAEVARLGYQDGGPGPFVRRLRQL